GIVKAMEALKEITGGNIEKMREFVPNVEALGPLLALTGSQFDSLASNVDEFGRKLGATTQANEKMMNTWSNQWTNLKNTITAVFLGLEGEAKDPVINLMKDLATIVKENTPAIQEALLKIGEIIMLVVENIKIIGAAMAIAFGLSMVSKILAVGVALKGLAVSMVGLKAASTAGLAGLALVGGYMAGKFIREIKIGGASITKWVEFALISFEQWATKVPTVMKRGWLATKIVTREGIASLIDTINKYMPDFIKGLTGISGPLLDSYSAALREGNQVMIDELIELDNKLKDIDASFASTYASWEKEVREAAVVTKEATKDITKSVEEMVEETSRVIEGVGKAWSGQIGATGPLIDAMTDKTAEGTGKIKDMMKELGIASLSLDDTGDKLKTLKLPKMDSTQAVTEIQKIGNAAADTAKQMTEMTQGWSRNLAAIGTDAVARVGAAWKNIASTIEDKSDFNRLRSIMVAITETSAEMQKAIDAPQGRFGGSLAVIETLEKELVKLESAFNKTVAAMDKEALIDIEFTGSGSPKKKIFDKINDIGNALIGLSGDGNFNMRFAGAGAGITGGMPAGITTTNNKEIRSSQQALTFHTQINVPSGTGNAKAIAKQVDEEFARMYGRGESKLRAKIEGKN
ncbi:MAG: hypothetical protein KAS32_09360, partial [Candidatus Peribacteraceae bacterium]|nr:hypothetical protein [Candidatus Peribacteraceae bacterium]